MKKRILLNAEFSANCTGYSTMTMELLSRLHATGKYEIAELAVYAKPNDPRINSLPWKVYPVTPDDGDAEGIKQLNDRPDAQYGSWKFEAVCLDFKPDVVMSYADPWMCAFHVTSPLRPFYRTLFMPTVDATPQTNDWAAQYTMYDGILSYTDFGKRVLKETCGNTINFIDVASPGASFTDMMVLDKKEIRAKYGIPNDIILLGMVARNQLRKGFPDLLETFRKVLDKADDNLAQKLFLHIHTAHPDQGWDIVRLLKEFGLSHKVYFTYCCRSCGKIIVTKWNDYSIPCRDCGHPSSVFNPNPAFGVTRKTLCEIYNLHDLYIQYAFLEGFGIPVVEAASCGVPTCVVPYSAMEDFVYKLDSYPIPIAKMITEHGSHRKWAYPNNNKFCDELLEILKTRDLKEWGTRSRLLCEKNFNWDNSAKIWERAIDSLPEPKLKWNSPRRSLIENPMPQNL